MLTKLALKVVIDLAKEARASAAASVIVTPIWESVAVLLATTLVQNALTFGHIVLMR